MASTPDFKPTFIRVEQSDRHDDVLAVIASLSGTSLLNIKQQAEVFGLPATGPYYPYIDADLIAKLLTSRGLVGTVWKEAPKGFVDLPEVAIAMVDYDADWEVGRCVLFHRLPASHPSEVPHYVLDPAMGIKDELQVRTDLTGLVASWYIGVHQAPGEKGKGKGK